MAKRFVIFGTKNGFDTATEDQYDETSIVFIEETKEIHLHGVTYPAVDFNIDDYLTKEDFEDYKEEIEQFKGSVNEILENGFKTINGESIVGEGDIKVAAEIDLPLEKGSGTNSVQSEGSTASGNYSFAVGQSCKAESEASVALGNRSSATGNGAVALGNSCTSNGVGAVALGTTAKATGLGSICLGQGESKEQFGVSMGLNNVAGAERSVAMCDETQTLNSAEVSCGRVNEPKKGSSNWGSKENTLFTVGNGVWKYGNSSKPGHNAFEVRQDGTIFIPDVDAEGEYHEKPMINLQEALKNAGGGSVDLPLERGNGQGTLQLTGSTATGDYSVALGRDCSSTNGGFCIGGEGGKANGAGSVVGGVRNEGNGRATVVFGDTNSAEYGTASAFGWVNRIKNESEFGVGRRAFSRGSGIVGRQFDGSPDKTIFVVGNGQFFGGDVDDEKGKHNAFEVRQNGDIYIPDTSGEGEYYEKPMINLQEALKNAGGSVDLPFEVVEKDGFNFGDVESNEFGDLSEWEGTHEDSDTFISNINKCRFAFGEGLYVVDRDSMVVGRYNRKLGGGSSGTSTATSVSGNMLFTVGCGFSDNHRNNALSIDSLGTVYIIKDPKVANSGSYDLQSIFKKLNIDNWETWTIEFGDKCLNLGNYNNTTQNAGIVVGSSNSLNHAGQGAIGQGLNVYGQNAFACGEYNKVDYNGDTLFCVGIGESRNGIEVKRDGHVYIFNPRYNEMFDLTEYMMNNGWM